MNEPLPQSQSRITLYALLTCHPCQRLKEFLEERGVRYERVFKVYFEAQNPC